MTAAATRHRRQGRLPPPRGACPEAAGAELQRLELLGPLVASVAHDFANILQAVQSVARLMERAADDPSRVRALARMLLETSRWGNALTGLMVDFTRRSNGPERPARDLVSNPASVIADVCQLLSRTLESPHTLCCTIDPEGLPLLVRGNGGELEAAVMNLAFNARDAMPDGGEVLVDVAAERVAGDAHGLTPGLYARISVTDSGVGMSPSVRERATELFFTTKPSGKGTGIGLASVKGFAERAGGALRIDSEQGHGAVVTLWLHAEVQVELCSIAG